MSTLLDYVYEIYSDMVGRDSPPTGYEIPQTGNSWAEAAAEGALTPERVEAITDALALAVRYDGRLTPAEEVAMRGEVESVGAARAAPPEDVSAAIARSIKRVDAVLDGGAADAAPGEPRLSRARELLRSIAARLVDPRARLALFRVVIRIARGSSDNPESAEELITLFAEAFGLPPQGS